MGRLPHLLPGCPVVVRHFKPGTGEPGPKSSSWHEPEQPCTGALPDSASPDSASLTTAPRRTLRSGVQRACGFDGIVVGVRSGRSSTTSSASLTRHAPSTHRAARRLPRARAPDVTVVLLLTVRPHLQRSRSAARPSFTPEAPDDAATPTPSPGAPCRPRSLDEEHRREVVDLAEVRWVVHVEDCHDFHAFGRDVADHGRILKSYTSKRKVNTWTS